MQLVVPRATPGPADAAESAIAEILDPEIPVITITELGILRAIDLDPAAGTGTVTITPTYSGCPAMGAIANSIRNVAAAHGYRVDIETQLAPAWGTDDIAPDGIRKLAAYGIAAPSPDGTARCPQCGSAHTEVTSTFGATACKTLRRCLDCREPFEQFKAF